MRLKKIITLAVIMASVSALLVSCSYFGSYPGYKKTKTGLYYKIYSGDNDDTARVRTGSIITMHYKFGIKDSTLFDSWDAGQPIVLQVAETQYEGDIYEGVALLKRGDSASFVFKAGPLFTKTFGQPVVPEFLTDESDIYFDVKVEKVQTQEEIEMEAQIKSMQMEQEEMSLLEEYIKANQIAVQPTTTGIYYLETKKGTGKTPGPEQYVSAHFTVSLLGGNQLFTTLEGGEPLDFKFGSQFENPGFMEVIGMMKEGGKANAIIPSSMAFGAQGAGNGIVPPFSSLYYDIELVKIITKEQFDAKQAKKQAEQAKMQAEMEKMQKAENAIKEKEEMPILEKYLKDNNITATTTLPSGLIYIETKAGTGPSAAEGKKVKVHYTGKLLDGTVFDSSLERGKPFEFTLGRGEAIEGWDLGIALMKEGGKANLIIPSKLAYKEQGAGGVIPPYATLLFEVELVEVEK
jgi:peptidylprolyl isomerase